MKKFSALAILFVAARAGATPPSPLWEDVAHPNAPRCAQLVGDARAKLEAGLREVALTLLREAVARCPEQYQAQALYGQLLFDAGNFDGARAALELARERQPPEERDAQLALTLGQLRMQYGDVTGSLSELRRAESLGGLKNNQRWFLQLDLGSTLMALGRLDEAIESFRRAIRLDANEPMARFALAVALDRAQESDRSRVELKSALGQDPLLRRIYSGRYRLVPPADAHYWVALAQIARARPALARAELRAFLAALADSPYAPRARDHLTNLGFVEPHELVASPGVDTHAAADALTPLVGELERCLDPVVAIAQSTPIVPPAPTVRVRITRSANVLRATADGSPNECLTALVARLHLPASPAEFFITLVLAPP